MSKFDKYRENYSTTGIIPVKKSKFDKYRANVASEILPTEKEDNIMPLIQRLAKSLVMTPYESKFLAKKFSKGVANTIDLLTALKDPNLIEEDYIYEENPKKMADLGDVREYIKDKHNIDLDPLPTNAFENIAGTAAEWAGSSILPIGGATRLIDGFKKAAQLQNLEQVLELLAEDYKS